MTHTEYASPRFHGVDIWPTEDLVLALVEGQLRAVASLTAASPALAEAIDAAAKRLQGGGMLAYAGAGTSGRIGAQDAAELWPTFNWPLERTRILMAGGEAAFVHAIERSEDDEQAARDTVAEAGLGTADVVIGLAASGRTPYTIAALDEARAHGALTIGIFNNPGSRLASVSDISVLLDTGGELVAGSTRMKAGTAQKAALNSLSTGIMIRLGFVYRGRMVEMRATNAKLDDRAIRMVSDLADCSPEKARQALRAADGEIKLAVLIASQGLDPDTARQRLSDASGHLRLALEAPGK